MKYVARNRDNSLGVHINKPTRDEDKGIWYSGILMSFEVPEGHLSDYDSLTWEDEPVPVNIIFANEI